MSYDDDVLTDEEFSKIVSKLPPEDAKKLRTQRKNFFKSARTSAIAAFMARNFSHGVGKHALR